MPNILSYFGLGDDAPDTAGWSVVPQTAQAATLPAEDKPTASGWDKFVNGLPGFNAMDEEQRSTALKLALLKGGLGMLAASQPRMGPAPTFGQALVGGMGGALSSLDDSGKTALANMMTGAQIGAYGAKAGNDQVDALTKRTKLLALAKFAQGDRSPEVLAAMAPDKYAEGAISAQNAPGKHLAETGRYLGPDGQVHYLPGYLESETALAGGKARAEAENKGYVLEPGGEVAFPWANAFTGRNGAASGVDTTTGNPMQMLVAGMARSAGVDPALALRVAGAESGFAPDARSPKGNLGIMQLGPQVIQDYGVKNPTDPVQNVSAGVRYLADLSRKYGGRQDIALLAYNWGPGNVDEWIQGGAKPDQVPAESKAYVVKVLGGAGRPAGQAPGLTRIQSSRDVPPTYESTADKLDQENLLKRMYTAQDNADMAAKQSRRMELMTQLLEGISTGQWEDKKLDFKRGLVALGLDPSALGIDLAKVGQQEAARALSNQITLGYRNPAGGEGMPGAMSEGELSFLSNMAPGLTMTTEGRRLLTEAQKQIEGRAVMEAKLYRDYRKAHGGKLDPGVFDALETLKAKPVLTDDMRKRIQAAAGGSPTGGAQVPHMPRVQTMNFDSFWR